MNWLQSKGKACSEIWGIGCRAKVIELDCSQRMNGCKQIQSLSSSWLQVAKVIDCGIKLTAEISCRHIYILSNWLWG